MVFYYRKYCQYLEKRPGDPLKPDPAGSLRMTTTADLTGTKVLHVLDRSIPNLSGYSIRSKYIAEFQSRMGLTPIVMTTPKYDREIPFERMNDIDYHRSYVKPESFEKHCIDCRFSESRS